MGDIDALESRITSALDRIRAGIESARANSVGNHAADGDQADLAAEVDALKAQLEEERTANAQLQDRLQTLKSRSDADINALQDKLAKHADQMAQIDEASQRVRQSNADLRTLTAQLRSAAADGATDPELVNRAMMAEIEALEAQRAAEVAEIAAIIDALKPLVEEA